MNKAVMLDIETLATSHDAAVIQIGGCLFDFDTGSIDETFLVSVRRDFYDGPHQFWVCPKTQAWWAQQSKDARSALDINVVSTPYLAFDRLVEWFDEKVPQGVDVWANPPQFDLVILRNLARQSCGDTNDVPWSYKVERDLRTLARIAGRYVSNEELGERASGLTAHRADHDAIRQAMIACNLMEGLKK